MIHSFSSWLSEHSDELAVNFVSSVPFLLFDLAIITLLLPNLLKWLEDRRWRRHRIEMLERIVDQHASFQFSLRVGLEALRDSIQFKASPTEQHIAARVLMADIDSHIELQKAAVEATISTLDPDSARAALTFHLEWMTYSDHMRNVARRAIRFHVDNLRQDAPVDVVMLERDDLILFVNLSNHAREAMERAAVALFAQIDRVSRRPLRNAVQINAILQPEGDGLPLAHSFEHLFDIIVGWNEIDREDKIRAQEERESRQFENKKDYLDLLAEIGVNGEIPEDEKLTRREQDYINSRMEYLKLETTIDELNRKEELLQASLTPRLRRIRRLSLES